MSKTNLYETIQKYRGMGALIFDKGRAQGKKMEEIIKDVEPLTKQLYEIEKKTVKEDIGAAIAAIKIFRAHGDGHRLVIKDMNQKIQDVQTQAAMVEQQIIDRMLAEKVEMITEGDYSATLQTVDGKHVLSLR